MNGVRSTPTAFPSYLNGVPIIWLGHPERHQQRCLWWSALLLSYAVLDAGGGGRSDIGHFDDHIADNSGGNAVLATNAILQTNYALSSRGRLARRGGYTRAQFYGIDRLDNGWLAGASFNYEIWRNLRLTLDYQ